MAAELQNTTGAEVVVGLHSQDGHQQIPGSNAPSIHGGPTVGSGGVLEGSTPQQSSAPVPSDATQIDCEIIISPEEPSIFTRAYARNSMPPPSIPDEVSVEFLLLEPKLEKWQSDLPYIKYP